MKYLSIKNIPNLITLCRLLLAVPIFCLIINEHYLSALWLTVIAGLSDGIDGYLARRLNALSRYGAIVDPLSDKVLLLTIFSGLLLVGLLPWWLLLIIVLREAIIVGGALAYFYYFGRYQVVASRLGKLSTLVQIVFVLLLLIAQVAPVFPEFIFQVGQWLLILLAFVSAGDYVYIWRKKALQANAPHK